MILFQVEILPWEATRKIKFGFVNAWRQYVVGSKPFLYVFEAVSPAEIKSAFHRLVKLECFSLLNVRFRANAFELSERLSVEW